MELDGYLYTSSLAVYNFDTSTFKALSDKDAIWDTIPSPYDLYGGYAKRMGELAIKAHQRQYNWKDAFIVRPSNIYGKFDNFGEGSMVIPTLIKRGYEAAKTGEKELKVLGSGNEIRTFTYAHDCARAIKFAMENRIPIANIAGTICTISDIAYAVAKYFNLDCVFLGDSMGDISKIIDNRTLIQSWIFLQK